MNLIIQEMSSFIEATRKILIMKKIKSNLKANGLFDNLSNYSYFIYIQYSLIEENFHFIFD